MPDWMDDETRKIPLVKEDLSPKHPQWRTTPKHDDPDGLLADTRGRTGVRSDYPVPTDPTPNAAVWFIVGALFGTLIFAAGLLIGTWVV